MRTAAQAIRNIEAAVRRGDTPSLADRLALEQAGVVDPLDAEPEASAPEPVDTTARTSRPQPAPQPPAPAPANPAEPVMEEIMTARARLMNPHMDERQIRAVVRQALAYLR